MGCFDSVFVQCPSCGGTAEFQSKVGECCLGEFRLGQIPPVVAGDLDGETSQCLGCGKVVTLRTQVTVIPEWS